jgi:hypothetical protein
MADLPMRSTSGRGFAFFPNPFPTAAEDGVSRLSLERFDLPVWNLE